MHQSGYSFDVTKKYIQQYIRTYIPIRIVCLLYTSYWSNELQYLKIADTIRLKRFEKTRRYLGFVVNTSYTEKKTSK